MYIYTYLGGAEGSHGTRQSLSYCWLQGMREFKERREGGKGEGGKGKV